MKITAKGKDVMLTLHYYTLLKMYHHAKQCHFANN